MLRTNHRRTLVDINCRRDGAAAEARGLFRSGFRSAWSSRPFPRIVAGFVPATPLLLRCAFLFGVAGTSPAATPVRDSRQPKLVLARLAVKKVADFRDQEIDLHLNLNRIGHH